MSRALLYLLFLCLPDTGSVDACHHDVAGSEDIAEPVSIPSISCIP